MDINELRKITKENQDLSKCQSAINVIDKYIEKSAKEGRDKFTVIPGQYDIYEDFELKYIRDHYTSKGFYITENRMWRNGFTINWW